MQLRTRFPMLEAVSDHTKSKGFRFRDSFLGRRTICHNARKFKNFRDPPPVVFLLELDSKNHLLPDQKTCCQEFYAKGSRVAIEKFTAVLRTAGFTGAGLYPRPRGNRCSVVFENFFVAFLLLNSGSLPNFST